VESDSPSAVSATPVDRRVVDARLPAITRADLINGLIAVISPWLVSRVLVVIGTELGARYFLLPSGGYGGVPVLEPFYRWDAIWYRLLVHYGYAASTSGVAPSSYRVAFFPLYPLIARALGGSDWIMLLIPNLCFLAALALLHALARRRLDTERAHLVVWLLGAC
jgi:hypothetical protein